MPKRTPPVSVDQFACCSSSGCCPPKSQRQFTPASDGPDVVPDFEKLIPSEKKLDPAWVKSLTARGERTWYSGKELEKIGMPVGGICAGQVYLGGDGKLWHWDIFNQWVASSLTNHYSDPLKPVSPLEQGFAIRILEGLAPSRPRAWEGDGRAEARPSEMFALDRTGFSDIRFCGEYPMAFVEYKDKASPVSVALEAFSPFIPLNADDSSLPATVMRFTVKNTSKAKVTAELVGWLENAVCLHNRAYAGTRRNEVVHGKGFTFLDCSVKKPTKPAKHTTPDLVFEDWQKETYEGWTVEGTAFGSGPLKLSALPSYLADIGGKGESVVNSYASAPGIDDEGKGAKDVYTGKLTSKPFTIEHNFIMLWIGGGAHAGKTCVNLLVDGKVACTVTGKNDNRMSLQLLRTRDFKGRQGIIEIVDDEKGGWGHIGVGKITFTDKPDFSGALKDCLDYGTMGLALLGEKRADLAVAGIGEGLLPDAIFTQLEVPAVKELDQRLTGALGRKFSLAPGKEATVTFVVTWNFPNDRIGGIRNVATRRYAKRFKGAEDVAKYVAKNFVSLAAQTRLWHDTWYDSTLPYWFLDRTFLNASILATTTCHWFANDRFWGWEGVGCCHGTCTHVWHYAQAMARLFPVLERSLREMADYGIAFDPKTGIIDHRGEFNAGIAIDGQAGSILRSYREHQMSANAAFLRKIWPRVKKSLQCLITRDTNRNGIVDGPQHNTLDAAWYGPSAWLSGLYVAALRAGEEMAHEMGDDNFGKQCRQIFEKGQQSLVAQLFDGEYFFNKPDANHPEAVNSGSGCEIDQVMGQSWAWQVGLGRVLPEQETLSALRSLWKYNYIMDVGPYREKNTPGRWYAMPGEAGLLMCTFPRADWDFDKAKGQGKDAWSAMYFNECMNGFEYQAAGHMIWEGLLTEGLAVTHTVHDRYHASRRNPWNEIECGDHYARSMASYGVYLAACGFEYHGPKGHLGFAPRLTPSDFRVAFTTAEGWGTFSQKLTARQSTFSILLKWGKLRVHTLALALNDKPGKVAVKVNGKIARAQHAYRDQQLLITLASDAIIRNGQRIEVVAG